jgi:hypothetical protein
MTEATPWVKWRFDRWRNDEGLRLCSLAARGLWADLLAIMHGCVPYGHLVINGQPPTDKQIALMVGATRAEVSKILTELEKNGVFSRVEKSGVIYSRRMVRDNEARQKGRANGALGGNPELKKAIDENKDGLGDGLTPPLKTEKREREERERRDNPPPPLDEPTKPRQKARSQISPDWKPTAAGIAYAQARGVQPTEVRAFKDFHIAKGNTMADWDAAWRTWCNNAVKFGNATPLLKPRDDVASPMVGGF